MAVKNTLTLVVYSPGDIDHLDINDIVLQMDDGVLVGSVVSQTSEVVEGDALREGLIAIGNDGTFFEDYFFEDAGQDDGLETHPGISA